MQCSICNNKKDLISYQIVERMFGTTDVFSYFLCPSCQTLQIEDLPENIVKYYPSEYYSYKEKETKGNNYKNCLRKHRDIYLISGKGIGGKLLAFFFPEPSIMIYSPISPDSRILDVGCGSGNLVYRLKDAGFKYVFGIDPYNSETILFPNGAVIEKKRLADVNEPLDLITYHHSFEHIPTPLEELKRVSALLNPDGSCILRIPILDSYAWEKYKTNWVQLDAPRHLFIYSIKSITLLVREAGLYVYKTEFDSTEFQFWGSEQYMRNIPLNDLRSFSVNPGKSLFGSTDIRRFKNEAKRLNNLGKGDQVVIYLKKINDFIDK
jgi:SAM-dependent methyltransferase